jgi:hypothetical protein
MSKRRAALGGLVLVIVTAVSALSYAANEKNFLFQFVGKTRGGFEGSEIVKLYDPGEGVTCYILSPGNVRTSGIGSSRTFEGNNVGSISCLKTGPAGK